MAHQPNYNPIVNIEQLDSEEVYFVLDENTNVLAWNSSPSSPFFFGGMSGVQFLSVFPEYEHIYIDRAIQARKGHPVRMAVVIKTSRGTYIRCELTISFMGATGRWVGSIRHLEEAKISLSNDERAELVAKANEAQATLREWNVELRNQITETDRAIKSLWESREAIAAIVDTAYDAYLSTDSDGIITEWNPKAEETFGWKRNEAVGMNLCDTIIPERFRESHRQGMARFVETGQARLLNKRIEIFAIDVAGREFPIQLTFWHTNIGDRLQFHAFLHDISERKASEEQLTKFFALVPNLMCITNLDDNTFVRVNSAWAKQLGWSESDLVGQDILSFIHPDDLEHVYEQRIKMILEGRDTRESKSRVRHKDGHYLTMCWKSSSPSDDGLIYSVASIMDD